MKRLTKRQQLRIAVTILTMVVIGRMAFVCGTCANIAWMNAAALSQAFHRPDLGITIAVTELLIFLLIVGRLTWKTYELILRLISRLWRKP